MSAESFEDLVRATTLVLVGLSLADGEKHVLEELRILRALAKLYHLSDERAYKEIDIAQEVIDAEGSEYSLFAAMNTLKKLLGESQKERLLAMLWELALSDEQLDFREIEYNRLFSSIVGIHPTKGQEIREHYWRET